MPQPRIAVIIPAAGASTRFSATGVHRNKLDEDLGGRPLLQRTVELFTKNPSISETVETVIVAAPHDDEAYADFKLRHADRLALLGATICRGGKTHRFESVAAALEHVPPKATHIAVHDAARPCTPPDLIEKLFTLCADIPALVPGVAVSDTIKRCDEPRELAADDDPVAAILGAVPKQTVYPVRQTLDRSRLFTVQTPQVFAAAVLREAYEKAADLEPSAITDDAMLVEHAGHEVVLIEADPRNIKVTHASDIAIARAILGLRPPADRPTHKRF